MDLERIYTLTITLLVFVVDCVWVGLKVILFFDLRGSKPILPQQGYIVNQTMKKIRKFLLKRKAKRLYKKIDGYPMYNCGHRMQMTLDGYYFNLIQKFNRTLDKLSEIDKNCPTGRMIEN